MGSALTSAGTEKKVNAMVKSDHNNGQDRHDGEDARSCTVERRQHDVPAVTHDPTFVERRRGQERRRNLLDRRLGLDRRRGPGKRRSDDRRAAEEGQMSDEQFHFVMAIDEYKKANARPFPTWTEVLEIIKALGYRKVADPQPLGKVQADPSE
jgi:hypothetical protein